MLLVGVRATEGMPPQNDTCSSPGRDIGNLKMLPRRFAYLPFRDLRFLCVLSCVFQSCPQGGVIPYKYQQCLFQIP